MICLWFTGFNYYSLAVEKDRDILIYFYRDHMETRLRARFPNQC
jgi:hypothetical protein